MHAFRQAWKRILLIEYVHFLNISCIIDESIKNICKRRCVNYEIMNVLPDIEVVKLGKINRTSDGKYKINSVH
jgi:hypothetical protein